MAPAPATADVGIVMAMPIEAGYLIDSLTHVRRYAASASTVVEGELAGKLVTVIASGVGKAAAHRGAELLSAGHRPRMLISAGFAGALDPGLARNSLILPHEVCDQEGELIRIPLESAIPPGFESTRGRLLTVDRVVSRAAEKAELRSAHQAELIDMETSAVARFAAERSLRFVSVRIVSDTAEEELPPEVARMLSRSGSYQVGQAIRAIWQRPSAAKDFWSLHSRALESADRLARGLARIVEMLPDA